MQSTKSSSAPLRQMTHPFQNAEGLLILIPNRTDIEESQPYDELGENEDVHEPSSSAVRSVRRPSSIFSHDIWLGDHSGQSSTFSRDVRIGGWTNVGDQLGGAFVVYDCAIRTKEGTTIHAHKRYSAFVELYHTLKCTLPRHLLHFIPPLPPKSPFARYRPAFLDRRRLQLQYWLSSVLLHPEIGACQAVRYWVMD
ncbi:Phox homologous domain-containing protein [Scleroderma yunnanense]